MFRFGEHIQPSLMLVNKVKTYLSGAPESVSYWPNLQAFWLGYKGSAGTNALAYLPVVLVTTKKKVYSEIN